MSLTSAVHWWEESQLRVLVLTSLVFQFLLFIFSFLRRWDICGLVRSIIWLAYLASDAVAIYALATLFNRHKNDNEGGGGGRGGGRSTTTLEVVWAPILLLHLGGQDSITAYNIEDNELWQRHLVTAVSQVTVAIYVFCRSWPPGDNDRRLFQAAILLFVPGVLKCFHKAWALQRASFYSLVKLPPAAEPWKDEDQQGDDEMMYSLEEYVKQAKEFIMAQASVTIVRTRAGGEGGASGASDSVHRRRHPSPQRRRGSADTQQDDRRRRRREEAMKRYEEQRKRMEERGETTKIFVDLPSPYPRRLRIFKHFWELGEESAFGLVRRGLATSFLLLYTKLKTAGVFTDADLMMKQHESRMQRCFSGLKIVCRQWIQLSRAVLPWAAIAAFHQSHREAYTHTDVKITYVLLCSTAMLEATSLIPVLLAIWPGVDLQVHSQCLGNQQLRAHLKFISPSVEEWPQKVAQYSLTDYLVREEKKSWWMRIASFFECKDFLDRHCCCKSTPSPASYNITKLVLAYLKDGWNTEIQDGATYRRFNEHSKHWVLERNYRRRRPFDECVLVWHLATEFCVVSSSVVSAEHSSCRSAEAARREEATREEDRSTEMVGNDAVSVHVTSSSVKIEIETYRVGSSSPSPSPSNLRASKAALCRHMSNYMVYLLFINPEMLLPGSRRTLFKNAHAELKDILNKDSNQNVQIVDKQSLVLMKRVINTMREPSSNKGSTTAEESTKRGPKENFIQEAWALSQMLLGLGNEKMWEEISVVWVEMLCFSASRCRGYLHAKALGQGGEFLSYVWFLLFQMGMETFADKLQISQQEVHQIPSLWEWKNDGSAPPPPLLHRLTRSAPASPHRFLRSRVPAEYMV